MLPRRLKLACLFAALMAIPAFAAPRAIAWDKDISHWITFSSRGGWSIKHPRNWEPGSCQACDDLTDPKVFVIFMNHSADDGITVDPLADKPPGKSFDQWVKDSRTDQLYPVLSEDWTFVDKQPALRVKYRNPYGPTTKEAVFIVEGTHIFSISVEDNKNPSLYALYQTMVSTFKFSNR